MQAKGEYYAGLRGGLPIGLGYYAVSLAIGLAWDKAGFPPLSSALFSLTNMSSTGEFAGITIMAAKGGLLELAATTLLVNLRYLLMSVSLAGRLPRSVGTWKRMLMAAGITDEVYALNITRPQLTWVFYLGAMTLPVTGWTLGTLSGALIGQVFPLPMRAAAGILLYAMFIAIVIPPAKANWRVQMVVAVALVASLILNYAPYLRELEVGWRIIIATLIAAGVGATFLPYVPPECQASCGTKAEACRETEVEAEGEKQRESGELAEPWPASEGARPAGKNPQAGIEPGPQPDPQTSQIGADRKGEK